MDAVLVGLAYLAMLLSVVYATRGQGKKAIAATAVGVVALLGATYTGSAAESVANHLLVLLAVALGSGVLFALSRRRK